MHKGAFPKYGLSLARLCDALRFINATPDTAGCLPINFTVANFWEFTPICSWLWTVSFKPRLPTPSRPIWNYGWIKLVILQRGSLYLQHLSIFPIFYSITMIAEWFLKRYGWKRCLSNTNYKFMTYTLQPLLYFYKIDLAQLVCVCVCHIYRI